jgi:hypothetical protein
MDAEINNFIYMELYSGPKMVHGKYGETNVAWSIDRDSTFSLCQLTSPHMLNSCFHMFRDTIQLEVQRKNVPATFGPWDSLLKFF